ncbi:MAG: hypothetical protein WDA17_04410 [Sphaerochaetaceae bacterium]
MDKLMKVVIIILLLFLVASASLCARVVATQTIKLYGYIPQYTYLDFDENGELLFTSNNPNALLEVNNQNGLTLLSVIAN